MGNQKKKRQDENFFTEKLGRDLLLQGERKEEVFLSLILPVYNCAEAIGTTLESIKQQQYTLLEVIVVDAGSTDRTLEIIASYSSLVSRVYSVANYLVADMMNRGISLANGEYLSFIYPGTFYLSPLTYRTFSERITEDKRPDLVYCGSIQRETKREPKTILLPPQTKFLQKGLNFATTSACWFRADLFERHAKFNTSYAVRAPFDFFCRLAKTEIKTEMIDRIFVDFDYGRFSYGKAFHSAEETWRIIYRHFGVKKALLWLFTLDHAQIIKWLWSRCKLHFAKYS